MNPKRLLLKNVPEDIFVFLLHEQNKLKEEKRVSQYSLERTLYGIIRNCEKFRKEKGVET